MSFIKYILILFLLLTCIRVKAQQQNNVLSLQQCVDIAIKNNLQVKQNGLSISTDSISYLQAKENMLPSINGLAERTLNQGRGINPITNTYVDQSLTSDQYGLTANLNLFNGLAYQNAVKQTRLAYQAGKMDFQSAKDQVTLNVITTYLLVLDNEEQLDQTKSQLAVANEQVERSKILESQGANKAASDLYDLKGSEAGSQVAVVNAQNNVVSSLVTLFQLMNIPYNKDVTLQALNAEDLAGDYGINPDQVYQTALQQLASVKAVTLRRLSAEKGVKQAKGYLFPSLALSGGVNTYYSSAGQKAVFVDSTSVPTGAYINSPSGKQQVYSTGANYSYQNINYVSQLRNNYGTYVGLTLNIPIFNNRVKKNAVALAKITLLNNEYIEDNTKIQLQQSVEQAFYNMTAAYNKYQALKDQVAAYSESFRISKIRYDSGVLTSVDYIIAKNNMDAANLNLISARYDYFIYSKILDYYQGKLSF